MYNVPGKNCPTIGLEQIPNQAKRRSMQKGFDFTIMVVGESGLGKSTLINTLFLINKQSKNKSFSTDHQTTAVKSTSVEIDESGVKVRLTVLDTPGFGDAINNSDCVEPICEYIDQQFENYYQAENSLFRKNILDTRVHACIYFISPFGHGLKPLDIQALKKLHHRVNLIPVIGKSDALTRKELENIKKRLSHEFEMHEICLYESPTLENLPRMSNMFPMAVCGASINLSTASATTGGRFYQWGILDVENGQHCETSNLRNFIIIHMQDLQEDTHEILYENYRVQKIQSEKRQNFK